MDSFRPDAAKLVRVMLADDHAVVREGYRRLLELEPDVRVVGECADGEAARAMLDANHGLADVLVLDLSMPGAGGLAVLRAARRVVAGAAGAGVHDARQPDHGGAGVARRCGGLRHQEQCAAGAG